METMMKETTTHRFVDESPINGLCDTCGSSVQFHNQQSDHAESERATPRPWHRNVSPAWKYPIYADRNGDPNGRDWIHIAAVLGGNPNAEADLDLIILAVNNFDALVAALEQAQQTINELTWNKKITGKTRERLSRVAEHAGKVLGNVHG